MAIALHATTRPIYMKGNNFFQVIARLTPSGSYAAGGDVFDFKVLSKTSPKQPIAVRVAGESGFVYTYDIANKKLKVFQATTSGSNIPLAEHTAAAYAAGVTGDVITAHVIFK